MKELKYKKYLARFREKAWHCWYSKQGLQILGRPRKYKNRLGVIIGESKDKRLWLIKWDEEKTIGRIHKDFINYLKV